MHSDKNYQEFMESARRAFEKSYKQDISSGYYPFETMFPKDTHYVGVDDLFTKKVNEAVPIFGPRLQNEGLKIPGDEISIASYVRLSDVNKKPVDNGAWTLDRIRELPSDHPMVVNYKGSISRVNRPIAESVHQWFAIGRFQTTGDFEPPVFHFLYGLVSYDAESRIMGGLLAVTPFLVREARLDTLPDHAYAETIGSLSRECRESLRQAAAIAYL